LKALLARKKQFEGPKPCLEYFEGAAGPKRQFETASIENSLEGASLLCPKKLIQSVRKRQSRRKTLRVLGWHKREEHQNLEGNSVEKF
jgi:hypothetical protein